MSLFYVYLWSIGAGILDAIICFAIARIVRNSQERKLEKALRDRTFFIKMERSILTNGISPDPLRGLLLSYGMREVQAGFADVSLSCEITRYRDSRMELLMKEGDRGIILHCDVGTYREEISWKVPDGTHFFFGLGLIRSVPNQISSFLRKKKPDYGM